MSTAAEVPAAIPDSAEGLDPGVREKSLRLSVIDGCFHGGMVGLGENYLGAYAVFLGATPAVAAALGAWPALIGALFGALTVGLIDRFRRRSTVTIVAAAAAGVVYLLLVALPFGVPASAAAWGAVVCVVLYMASNNVANPAWNSWIGDLVPAARRGHWFGRRNSLIATVTLVSMLAAGALLDGFKARGAELHGWILCLVGAAAMKFISVGFLSRVAEPPYNPSSADSFTFWQFLRRSPQSNFARFTWGIALMWFCVHLSGPFFILYQLKVLGWSYTQLTVSTAIQTLSAIATQPWWGRVGDRRGSRHVLLASGLLCAVLPLLWCTTTTFAALLAIQVVAGFCWGGFNLATANFLFEAVTPAKRARCAAYFNVVASIGIFVGAAVGITIVDRLGARAAASGPIQALFSLTGLPAGPHWRDAAPFLLVFALSGLGRFPVLLFLRGVIDGQKAHEELRERSRQLAVPVKGDPGESM
ncbi:MAG: MFS transporter [Candidatus Brocadiae bacterium]|nr:MFS transporter [Candidatus Brocadiia bacterium]